MSFKEVFYNATRNPKFMFFTGVVLVIGGTVLVGVQSAKLEEAIEEEKKEIEQVHEQKETLPQPVYGRTLARSYGRLGWKLIRHYAFPVTIEIVGLYTMNRGFNVLNDNYISACAAAIALKMENERMYNGIVNEYGVEKANDIRRGAEYVEVIETNEKGKTKVKKVKTYKKDNYFNTTERRYSESGHYHPVITSDDNSMNDNINELKIFQVYANQFLAASKTHTCTLNDIYRILDFEETAWGDAFIWDYDPEHPNDHIKFGIDDLLDPMTRAWYLKQNDDIWLTFNCDRVTLEDPNDIYKLAPNGKIARGSNRQTLDSL